MKDKIYSLPVEDFNALVVDVMLLMQKYYILPSSATDTMIGVACAIHHTISVLDGKQEATPVDCANHLLDHALAFHAKVSADHPNYKKPIKPNES
jgi:hypothetical protein